MFGGRRAAIIALAVAFIATLSMPLAFTDASEAADTNVLDYNDKITVRAADTTTFTFIFLNNEPYVADSNENVLLVKVSAAAYNGDKEYDYITAKAVASSDSSSGVLVRDNTAMLPGGSRVIFDITLNADKFARQGDYTISYTVTVMGMDYIVESEDTYSHPLHVGSSLSTSDTYNKFLGIFPNELESPLDSVLVTVAVTIVAWFLIGIAAMCVAVPLITILMTRKDDPDRPVLRKSLIRWCLVIIAVFTVVNTLCVIGVDEHIIDSVKMWAHLIYLLVGLFITWRIYKTFLDRLTEHMRGRDMVAGGEVQDFESFKPLFIYIGEIVIAIAGVVIGLGMMDVDLAAIITSAGVVSLGITLGAQQVLNQFFSGLVILSTRPFRKGDIIQLAGNTNVTYRVRKVNVMNTELENWDNSDVTIVPNNSITANNVKNITRDTLRSKVHLFVDVSYKTDLALARAALLEVANNHPRVIKDGSVAKPATRVTGFQDSNITLRLTVWVDDYNDHGAIAGDLRVAIYKKFNEIGVNIDYPQVVLHMADPQSPRDAENATE